MSNHLEHVMDTHSDRFSRDALYSPPIDRPTRITIETTSRLHLGFMDMEGAMGRKFGSIGVSIKHPTTRLTIDRHEGLEVQCDNTAIRRRIEKNVMIFADHWKIDPNVAIHVDRFIPEHKGLGSGSQMTLAISKGMALLNGFSSDILELATIGKRGRRSSIGIHSFIHGGVIVDAGKMINADGNPLSDPPEKLLRMEFPPSWRFILILPEKAMGRSGRSEQMAMDQLAHVGSESFHFRENSEKICHLVMMKLLPALVSKDIVVFGEALSELDHRTGCFFEPVQHGIFSEKDADGLVETLIQAGAYGAGQSSWGPAIYGLVTADGAEGVAERVKKQLAKMNFIGEVLIVEGANEGARIILDPP